VSEELHQRVDQALEKIRPYLITDGGNVRIIEITDEMVVKLELLGSCGSCNMSAMTMKAGIQETVKREVPEIKEVIAINQD